nr:MAG TPA: Hint [Caudoviricetes sp.]
MIFTQGQIQDILSILKRYELIFIADQLGVDFLSQSDKDILIASGINLDKYTNKKGIVEHAFLWGILAEAIGDTRAKKMTYDQFQKFLASGNFIPLTEEEEFALQQVKNRAYTDITSLGSRMRTASSNIIIRGNTRQQVIVQNIIKQKTIKAVELRYGARTLASDFGNATKDWERDWLRIAYYLLHEAYNVGRSQSILKNHGADAKVYFDVYIGACDRCKELYLTDPDDVNSEPIIFKLKDLIANGNNIGRKAADWLPTIAPTHPYCFNSKSTKIYTSKGWTNISKIKIGDLVLTHRNRFRKVTNVFKRPYEGEELYNIYYVVKDLFGNKKIKKVKYITGNHPVLSNGKWIEAKNLKIKDEVSIQGIKCTECGKYIPLYYTADNDISRSVCVNCKRKMSAKKQWQDEDFKKFMSNCTHNQMIERYKDMSHKDRLKISQKARETLKSKYPSGHPWMLEAIKKANKTNGKKKTFIERKLLYFCNTLGFKTVTNLCLKNNGNFKNNVTCYFPDIFIPSLKIILEADGINWHKNKKYDENRDLDIKNNFNFDTFRFSEEDILNNGDSVFNELKNLFNNHSGKFENETVKVCYVEKIKKNKFCNSLYNFSVEEDESYIADGIIVHNCRCTINYKKPGYDWNPELRAFTIPKKIKPKNPKLQGVKLNIRISKAVEDELNKAVAAIGEIRQWGDGMYKKIAEGKWAKVRNNKVK